MSYRGIMTCSADGETEHDTEKTGQSMESEAEGIAEESDTEQHNVSEQHEHTEDKGTEALTLSEEALARIQLAAEEYYTSINRKMLSFTQADPASSFHRREYEGYEPGEAVLFEVSVEDNGPKRYITIGSKDGWINCSVLNEGY